MRFLNIKAHWLMAVAMATTLPSAATAQDIILTDAEQEARAAYQKYLICAGAPHSSNDSKPVWQIQDDCLADAARQAGFKKPHDVLKKANDIIRQHGFVAVMTDEERPALSLLKEHLACMQERARNLGRRIDEETDLSCAHDRGVREQDRVLWSKIISKYGPDSVR